MSARDERKRISMSPASSWNVLFFFMAVVLLGRALPVLAQSPGFVSTEKTQIVPLVRKSGPSWWSFGRDPRAARYVKGRYFYMAFPATGIRLRYEFMDEIRTQGDVETTDLYHQFSERIGLSTYGWVYHPTIMKYTLSFEPQFAQLYEEISSPGAEKKTGRLNVFSPDYAVTATFLDPKPYTFRLFSSRREEPVWAPFSGAFETVTTDYGGDVDLDYVSTKAGRFHSNLGYRYTDSSLDGRYTSDYTSDRYFLSLTQFSARSNTRLTANYDDSIYRRQYDFSAQDHVSKNTSLDVYLSNTFDFEGDTVDDLYTDLIFLDQEYDGAGFSFFSLRTYYETNHDAILRRLRAQYTLAYDRSWQDSGAASDRYAGRARWNHLLYENLFTNLAFSSGLNNNQGSRDSWFNSNLGINYTRRIPYGSISLSANWNDIVTHRERSGGQFAAVNNERHILGLTREVLLNNPGIAINTIVVTNGRGNIVYLENIDYRLDLVGDYIRISPLPFGAIENGQEVVVRYSYRIDPSFDDNSLSQGYTASTVLFQYLELLYSYNHTTQTILSGTPPDNLADYTMQRARIRWNMRWSDTYLSLADSNSGDQSGFRRWDANQLFTFSPWKRIFLNLSASYGETEYDNGNHTENFRAFGRLTWRMYRWASLYGMAYYEQTDGNSYEYVRTGLDCGMELRYRIWSATLRYQLEDIRNENDEALTEKYGRLRHLVRFDIIRLKWYICLSQKQEIHHENGKRKFSGRIPADHFPCGFPLVRRRKERAHHPGGTRRTGPQLTV